MGWVSITTTIAYFTKLERGSSPGAASPFEVYCERTRTGDSQDREQLGTRPRGHGGDGYRGRSIETEGPC